MQHYYIVMKSFIQVLLFSTLFILFLYPSKAQTVSKEDSLALVALYNGTEGDKWIKKDNWLSGPVDTWWGVYIFEKRVSSLILNGNNLNGYIPDEVGNLEEVGNIQFSNNKLKGKIPESIGNLKSLVYLELYNNELQGHLPASLFSLEYLNVLSLGKNRFIGEIDSAFAELELLTQLNLRANQFSGDVSEELVKLRRLEVLDISGNKLTAIPFLSESPLQTLNIYDNHFTFDDILPYKDLSIERFIYRLQSEVQVYQDTILNPGEAFEFFLEFDSQIVDNQYTWYKDGEFFVEGSPALSFGSISTEDEGVYTCEIINPRLADLKLTTEPLILHTRRHNPVLISDSLALVSLYQETHGDQWKRNSHWLKEPVYTWYGVDLEDGRVISLNLVNNQLEGALTEDIFQLNHLKTLDLSYNQISGELLSKYDNLDSLKHLNLAANVLTGSIPEGIGSLKYLQTLNLIGNHINGILPDSLGELTNLKRILLSHNYISGSIPKSVGKLVNLLEMNIGNNQLIGEIPLEIEKLSELTTVYLNNNNLSGSLPVEIGKLAKLELLVLSYNNLEGEIPVTILSKPGLKADLLDNKFNRIPAVESVALGELNVYYNQLTFDDILPLLELQASQYFSFAYYIQDTLGQEKSESVFPGHDYSINLGIDTLLTENLYTWYKDGEIYTTTDVNHLDFNNFTEADAGVYTCQVTNPQGTYPILNFYPVTLQVKKLPQTITFENIEDKTFGDSAFALNASASSGLPIHFDITGPVELQENILFLNGAGEVKITAIQSGNSLYEAADSVWQSFTVKKASQVITFANLEDIYIDHDSLLLDAVSSADLPITYQINGPAELADSILHFTGTGTVEVTALQGGNENVLAAETVVQTFEILPRLYRISGQVSFENQELNKATKVSLFKKDAEEKWFILQEKEFPDGFFVFDSLQAGQYTIKASANDAITTYYGGSLIRREATLILLDTHQEGLEIILSSVAETKGGEASISGILLKSNKKESRIYFGQENFQNLPLSNVSVYLVEEKSKSIVGDDLTDHEGRFTFEGLTVDNYLLRIDYEDTDMAENQVVAVTYESEQVMLKAVLGMQNQFIISEVERVLSVESEINPVILSAYPNPTSDEFVLTDEEGYWNGAQILLFDLRGKFLEERIINASRIKFNLVFYPKGIYQLVIQKGDRRQVLRIIKI